MRTKWLLIMASGRQTTVICTDVLPCLSYTIVRLSLYRLRFIDSQILIGLYPIFTTYSQVAGNVLGGYRQRANNRSRQVRNGNSHRPRRDVVVPTSTTPRELIWVIWTMMRTDHQPAISSLHTWSLLPGFSLRSVPAQWRRVNRLVDARRANIASWWNR